MYLRRHKMYIDKVLKVGGFALFILLGLAFVIFSSIRTIRENNASNSIKNNMFYAQIVNYTLPIVKTTTYDEADMAESQFSVKTLVFQSMGINIDNPIKVMAKEISYFRTLNLSVEQQKESKVNISFNPFSLEESYISRQSSEQLPPTDKSIEEGQSKNAAEEELPNKLVNIYDPKLKTDLNAAKPQVLIYHTHTTESFAPYGRDNDDAAKNICAVGDELKNELEKNYGIAVIHDKTVHNSSYIKSYSRSKETLDGYMKKYGDFKLIIDMHRDGGVAKNSVTTKMNGKNAARIMFVMSKGNPRFKQNQAVVDKLLEISKKLFPGFDKGVMYYNNKTNHFNAERSNNAVLIEVGADNNTFDEAKESSKYLGRIIGEYINGKR
jgi:stage II sporulation protein P